MSDVVRRTSRQSGAVYTTLQVISHQMSPWRRVDKLVRDKSNQPKDSLQQYENLTDGTTNDLQKTGAFDSGCENNLQQEDSPFGETDLTHWVDRMTKRNMRTFFQILNINIERTECNEMLGALQQSLFIISEIINFVINQR